MLHICTPSSESQISTDSHHGNSFPEAPPSTRPRGARTQRAEFGALPPQRVKVNPERSEGRPWDLENHRKTIGKPLGKWWFHGILCDFMGFYGILWELPSGND